MRTHVPSSWKVRSQFVGHTELLAFGNEQLHDPCTSVEGGTTCSGWPVTTLDPGGIFVGWITGNPVRMSPAQQQQALDLAPGRSISVDGQPAKIAIDPSVPDDGCSDVLHTARSITARVFVREQTQYAMTACLRGPHLSKHTRQVEAMVRATQFPQ
jgi:hypothetical protein